jgi:hypothetical protein
MTGYNTPRKAMIINVSEIGGVKKIVRSPLDRLAERTKLISEIGPRTRPRMRGARTKKEKRAG